MAALETRKFITRGDQQNFPGSLQHLPGSSQRICRIHRIPQITFRSSPDRLRIFPRRSRRLHHQLRVTSWRHHRAPHRPGGRRAPTPEELRQAATTPAKTLYGPPRPLLGPTEPSELRPKFPSEERPIHQCTAPCQVPKSGKPPLYQDK
ncbi:hypothetical protein MTP99_003905 [Tenebrio molitor]|nr:hypothetical protein MTP99_003905 [Tenebrio molitor]